MTLMEFWLGRSPDFACGIGRHSSTGSNAEGYRQDATRYTNQNCQKEGGADGSFRAPDDGSPQRCSAGPDAPGVQLQRTGSKYPASRQTPGGDTRRDARARAVAAPDYLR